MARISLLLCFPFALALSSLFLSVSAHAPLMQPRISAIPKTVSELQTFPFTEITQILNRKERFASKSVEFKAMFTIYKGYVAYLESLYKAKNPNVDVLGVAKAKYTLMNKAIFAAEATISGKVDKETSLKLKKISAGLTKELLKIQETIITTSAKHNFNTKTKITIRESKNICNAIITFKKSINAFMKIIYDIEERKLKKIGHPAKVRKEARVKNVFGRELTEAQASGKTRGSFRFGGKVFFDAAGKMKFVGKDGFRSLNRVQYKHFVSTHP